MDTVNTRGGATSNWSENAANGHLPASSPSPKADLSSVRSMSSPGNAARRSATEASVEKLNGLSSNKPIADPATLLPSALHRSPTASSMVHPSPSTLTMSKRSHLIREIATTERKYASDLALVRDAYLSRPLRPTSHHSVTESSITPGHTSDASRRSSIYTFQTAETKRSSGHDSLHPPWVLSGGVPTAPMSGGLSRDDVSYGSGTPLTATASTSSISTTPQPSPKNGSLASNVGAIPIGLPLSPADTKSVFLNLEQLATMADDLATAFEGAMGEDEAAADTALREGEGGNDKLGEVFMLLVSLGIGKSLTSASPPSAAVCILLRQTELCVCSSA